MLRTSRRNLKRHRDSAEEMNDFQELAGHIHKTIHANSGYHCSSSTLHQSSETTIFTTQQQLVSQRVIEDEEKGVKKRPLLSDNGSLEFLSPAQRCPPVKKGRTDVDTDSYPLDDELYENESLTSSLMFDDELSFSQQETVAALERDMIGSPFLLSSRV